MSERPPTDTETRRWRMRNHPAYRLPAPAAALREALQERDAEWCASHPQTPSPRPVHMPVTAGARGPVRFIPAAEYIARERAREVPSS